MATKPAPLIAKATLRVEANAFAKAVELLVTAWRGHRSPRIAALAERAGRLANESVLPEPLIRVATPAEQIEALGGLPQDPRIVPALLAIARRADRPVAGLAVGMAFVEAILAQQDPATPGLVAAIDVKGKTFLSTQVELRLRAPLPAPSAEIETACDACDRALLDAELRVEESRERGQMLLAAIYREPADHGLRAIYADWLAEQGDPQGEFIALQLLRDHTEPQRARLLELEAAHGRAWLGQVANACAGVWFDAGFPAGASTDAWRLVAFRDAPEWATITALTFASPQPIPVELVGARALRNLRYLGGVDTGSIAQFRRERSTLPITGIGITNYHGQFYDLFEVFALVESLELEELGFDAVPATGFARLFEFASAHRISRVRMPRTPNMAAAIATLPGHVTTAELAMPARAGWEFTWSRAPGDPRWSRLAIEHRPDGKDIVAPVDELTAMIGALPTDQLEACSLRLIGSRAGGAELAALATILARQRRLAELALPAR